MKINLTLKKYEGYIFRDRELTVPDEPFAFRNNNWKEVFLVTPHYFDNGELHELKILYVTPNQNNFSNDVIAVKEYCLSLHTDGLIAEYVYMGVTKSHTPPQIVLQKLLDNDFRKGCISIKTFWKLFDRTIISMKKF